MFKARIKCHNAAVIGNLQLTEYDEYIVQQKLQFIFLILRHNWYGYSKEMLNNYNFIIDPILKKHVANSQANHLIGKHLIRKDVSS